MRSHELHVEALSEDWARAVFWGIVRGSFIADPAWRTLTDADVQSLLETRGYDCEAQIAKLMADHRTPVLEFENLFSDRAISIEADTSDLTVSLELIVDGVSLSSVEMNGLSFGAQRYTDKFAEACASRDRCIQFNHPQDLLTALGQGLSAIDAFLNERAFIYNARAKPHELLTEKFKKGRLNLKEKLKLYIPILSNYHLGVSQSLELENGPAPAALKRVTELRNKADQHPQVGAGVKNLDDLAYALNDFRNGIADLLFACHCSIGLVIPSAVVRAARFPTIVARSHAAL